MTNTCLRCNHSWMPRTVKRSRQCPKCQTSNWDGSVIRQKFDFVMGVGEQKFYHWPEPLEHRPRLFGALMSYQRRHKQKFYIYPETKGMTIRRVL